MSKIIPTRDGLTVCGSGWSSWVVSRAVKGKFMLHGSCLSGGVDALGLERYLPLFLMSQR
jgi:hypothetical protein